jgi:hypothetical protein
MEQMMKDARNIN